MSFALSSRSLRCPREVDLSLGAVAHEGMEQTGREDASSRTFLLIFFVCMDLALFWKLGNESFFLSTAMVFTTFGQISGEVYSHDIGDGSYRGRYISSNLLPGSLDPLVGGTQDTG